jgi:hypothetical protein
VSDRFVLREFDALRSQRTLLTPDRTGSSAVGARLLIAQGGGLTLKESLEGAFGEALGRGVCDLFHHVEVDIESGTVAERAVGDDFPPRGGELTEFEEFLWGERTTGHEASSQGVTTKPCRGLVPDDLRTPTSHGKAAHDLCNGLGARLS